MDRGFRLDRRSWALLICLSGWCPPAAAAETKQAAAAAVGEQRAAIVESFRHDAALADVQFIDRRMGWAVGDRGVIWHTNDGGATWQRQTTPVECRLNAVFFLDAQRGWAVGGVFLPYHGASRGVVLRTSDGGTNWQAVARLVLPCLSHVQFFDGERGIAVGEASAFDPSGVFVTSDGGGSWQALPSDRGGGWIAADFLDPDNGAVAGANGRFATLARRQVVHSPFATAGLPSHRAMRLLAPTGGWLVGDGGLVLKTSDLGHSWQSPPAELPYVAASAFDFHALAVQGSKVWIAGTPGTRVWHSPDDGQSWQAAATGSAAPIRALAFADAEHGWAVGELGTILATRDGGRSWTTQRSGGERAAVLGLFADVQDVPLELLAAAGAAEGYIAAIDILHATSEDVGRPTGALALGRTREALLLAGAATAETAWRFPLSPGELALTPVDHLDALDRTHDGRAMELLERHLVRALRMWRPEVVVTHHDELERSTPRASVLAAVIKRAIAAAADPAQHTALATEAGLPPWQVEKVYGLLPEGAHGAESITTGRFSPWLGTTLGDFAAPARRLLNPASLLPPVTHELELLMSEATVGAEAHGLLDGVSLEPGSGARRPRPELPINDLDELRRLATRRRHLEELLDRTGGNAAWAAQVANLTDGLSDESGGQLLMQLADGYRAAGQLDLAADTYYLLARRYPDQPLADRALAWLVQFYASSEAGFHSSPRQTIDLRPAEADQADIAAPAVGLSRDDRLRRAIQLAQYLQDARPRLYAEPALRFAELSAQRQLGFANPAQRYFLSLAGLPPSDPWRECAETEQWLTAPDGMPPRKPIATCRRTIERPHLDGHLDEPFWQGADRIRLRNTGAAGRNAPEAAEVRLAYDNEFLYLAVNCSKAPGDYPADDRPRLRDADLQQHDRVTVRLDLDRDYTTAFELTVDHRGWTHDACWGDASWNPSWYVASASDAESWTIEAAVPLAELTTEPPAARHVWAVAVRRTIPRVGYQSWTAEAAEDSPAQFGLLIFD